MVRRDVQLLDTAVLLLVPHELVVVPELEKRVVRESEKFFFQVSNNRRRIWNSAADVAVIHLHLPLFCEKKKNQKIKEEEEEEEEEKEEEEKEEEEKEEEEEGKEEHERFLLKDKKIRQV